MRQLFNRLFIVIGFISTLSLYGLQEYKEKQPKTIDEVNEQINEQERKVKNLTDAREELQQDIDSAQEKEKQLRDKLRSVPAAQQRSIQRQIDEQVNIISSSRSAEVTTKKDLEVEQEKLDSLVQLKEQLMSEFTPSEPAKGKEPIQPVKQKTIIDSLISSLVEVWTKLKAIFTKDAITQRAKNSLKTAQKNLVDYENRNIDSKEILSWQNRLDLRKNASQYGKTYNQLVSDYNQAEKNYKDRISSVIKSENPYADQIKQLKTLSSGQLEEFGNSLTTVTDDQINNYLNNRYQEEYKSTNPYYFFGISPKESTLYTLNDIAVLYKNALEYANPSEREALNRAYYDLRLNKDTIDSNIAYLITELDAYNASLNQAIAQAQKQVFTGL